MWSGGSSGPFPRRSHVEPGSPFLEGEKRLFLDKDTALVQMAGVSADDVVEL
jgi:hypothetical protein